MAIYNVYLHPLRKFPGPWLAKATPLPFTRRLLNGQMVDWTLHLHRKYGDVVRIQPDELSFTLAQAWTDVFASRPQLPKPEKGTIVPPNGVRFFATFPKPEDHSRHRRILGHAFSDRALKEQEYILQNYTDFYITRLHDQVEMGVEIDICNWNMFLMFDIICDLCFAESFNSLENAAYHPWYVYLLNHCSPPPKSLIRNATRLGMSKLLYSTKVIALERLPSHALFKFFRIAPKHAVLDRHG